MSILVLSNKFLYYGSSAVTNWSNAQHDVLHDNKDLFLSCAIQRPMPASKH